MTMQSIDHSSLIGERLNLILASLHLPSLPDHVLLSFIVSAILIGLGFVVRRNISFVPTGIQNVIENLFKLLEKSLFSIIGPKGPRYFPVIGTLALFILTSNLLGLLPFLGSPTNNLNVTLGCALYVFFYYHYHGLKELGFRRYTKHFIGPIWWLAPFMVPLEIISHLSRVMSLSIRLFGNIMGEDIILLILFLLSPWYLPLPVPMMIFAIFTSILQTYIFIVLSMMYIAGAVAEEVH
ncbi:F0F1 ATP synthase subunit A [bacterium]|nr:F0F1 ATP synthase subunit A [bacterium]